MSNLSKPRLSPAEAAKAVFDLQDAREARKYIPHTKFSEKVAVVRDKFDARTFRKLCFTAVAGGLASSQDIVNNCGDVIPRNLKKLQTEWPVPSPVKCREVLAYFSTLNAEAKAAAGKMASSDNKLGWQHEAKPKQVDPGIANYIR